MEYNEKFIDWCYNNGLYATQNTEMFFINERASYRPQYIVNNKIFVDIIPDSAFNEKYAENCERFRKSFAPIIIIPVSVIDDLNKITISDINERFNTVI